MVVFEVPTGVVADTRGRRASYLLGTVTLIVTTLLYHLLWQIRGPFWGWAVVSALLGLGFTFFSGAVEAWLVDALNAAGFEGSLESVLGRGAIVNGVAMLGGSVSGGYVAQLANLGVPYLVRSVVLALTFALAFARMRDVGFTPEGGGRTLEKMRGIVAASIEHGWKVPAVKWTMLAAPLTGGVSIYAFYALQPYLLELYGDPSAYGVAGLAAAVVAGAEILGGFAAPRIRQLFQRRTSALLAGTLGGALSLALMGLLDHFWTVVALVVVWGLLWAALGPIRQAYINEQIPSRQRATILSFDSLMGSSGGVVIQPALGRAADVWSYATSYLLGAAVNALALPFILRARRENVAADSARGATRRAC